MQRCQVWKNETIYSTIVSMFDCSRYSGRFSWHKEAKGSERSQQHYLDVLMSCLQAGFLAFMNLTSWLIYTQKKEGENQQADCIVLQLLEKSIIFTVLISCLGITMTLLSCVWSHHVWSLGGVASASPRKKQKSVFVVAIHEHTGMIEMDRNI